MLDLIFKIEYMLWTYIGLLVLVGSGMLLSFLYKFPQTTVIRNLSATLKTSFKLKNKNTDGINPIKLYFASVGGMVGLGNILAVSTAVAIGGPGALFWLWVSVFFGSILKYSEIYLGIKYRKKTGKEYLGGPIMFLKEAFHSRKVPIIFCILMSVYGIEIYQFNVMVQTIESYFGFDKIIIIIILLSVIIYTCIGSINRFANICTVIMPVFFVIYIFMGLFIIFYNIDLMPALMKNILIGAFTGKGAMGAASGFAVLKTMQQGISKSVYSGDLAIGYDSTIQSQTKLIDPKGQSKIAVFGVLSDAIICTISMLIVLLGGFYLDPSISDHQSIVLSLSKHFPFVDTFMLILIFLAGYTTVSAYFIVGLRSFEHLFKNTGKLLYVLFGSILFPIFCFFDSSVPFSMMQICGGLLMIINCIGILKLRKQIEF